MWPGPESASPRAEDDDGTPGLRGWNAVLIPVFNDWKSAEVLVERLDLVLGEINRNWALILIDDSSTDPPPQGSWLPPLRYIDRVCLLRLRRNMGHQRAIAIGLAFVEAKIPCDSVVIMDGDGEDLPSDVPRLVERLDREDGYSIVFAERSKRTEGLIFKMFYHLYRYLHWILTGVRVRVGNFSVVPRQSLRRLVAVSDLWNHYAASVFNSRLPYVTVPTVRGRRFHGRSKMNFVSLMVHGLSAISVYRDRVLVRLLLVGVLSFLASLTGLLATLLIRLTTNLAIPGWATYTCGLFALMMIQICSTVLVLLFVTLGARETLGFLPSRDYTYFIDEFLVVAEKSAGASSATAAEEQQSR
jgi:glycosyltransferase involved in cell wall biosynthesis